MKIIPDDIETQGLYCDLLWLMPDTLTLDVRNPEHPEIHIPGGRLPVPGGLDGLPALIRTVYIN